jgi:hypothetical protein
LGVRQEILKFKGNMGYVQSPCLEKKKKERKEGKKERKTER